MNTLLYYTLRDGNQILRVYKIFTVPNDCICGAYIRLNKNFTF